VQIGKALKKKAEMLIVMSVSIIVDVIPIIFIMAGIWIVRYFSNLFGFEGYLPVKILIAASEIFMVILYLALVVASLAYIYKLFKEGEL